MRRSTLALGLLLAFLACLANAPALDAGFLWDDDALISASVFETLGGLRRLWLEPSAIPLEQHYWPVTYTSFWIEAQLWGLEPRWLHATNLALHALNCLLLWRLLASLRLPSAWWVTALFAVHPIHVESVAWIIERKDLLSTLFYLLAARVYLARDHRLGVGRSGGALLLVTCLLFALASWSKSVALSLPVGLGLLQWARQGGLSRRELRDLLALLVFGLALAAFDLARATGMDSLEDLSWTLSERVRIAGRALSFYASSLVVPTALTPVVPRFDLAHWSAWLHPLAWLGVLVIGFQRRATWTRWPAALLAIWMVTLAPMLCLIPYSWMRHSFVADRFQYLASAAALVLLVEGGRRLLRSWSPELRGGLAGLIVVGFTALSFSYTERFAHADSHARRIVERNPAAWVGHFNLAAVLRREGDLEAALQEFDSAIRARPDFAGTHNNRGDLLMSMGRRAEAEEALRQALALDPDLPTAHSNLGLILTGRQEWELARGHFERAIELRPSTPAFRVNLGLLYAKSGELDRAEQAFREVLELEPQNAIALQSLETIRRLRAGEL